MEIKIKRVSVITLDEKEAEKLKHIMGNLTEGNKERRILRDEIYSGL